MLDNTDDLMQENIFVQNANEIVKSHLVCMFRWSVLHARDHRHSKAPLPQLLGPCPACGGPVAEQHRVWSG